MKWIINKQIVFLFFMLFVSSAHLQAKELERDWYTPRINQADNWRYAIHAREGVNCRGCHVDSDKAKKKTVSWFNNKSVTVTLLTREEYDVRCITCHAKADASFLKTFHGKHELLGKKNIPTCSYCHAGHEYPLDSDKNPLQPEHIGQVCAGCHSAENKNIKTNIVTNLVAASKIHLHQIPDSYSPLGLKLSSWINIFYTLLLIVVVGFFIFYFIIDLPTAIRERKASEQTLHSLTKTTVWIHGLFALSFVILAITGFSIKYPDSEFSSWVMWFIGDPDNRSIIHRLAALGFIGSGYVFFIYALIKRLNIKALLPRPSDWAALKQSVKFRLGLIDKNDESHEAINWITKFEFWASVIGMHIVLITGLLMWFMEWTLASLDYSIFKYAQQIHGWEAILATTAILLVHGYLMLIRPRICKQGRRQ
ncbi:MAG: hypothetical protein BMS9Abin31_1004 [Gammaproteobacteria bacterium]|nr:MAG: hypothetical protein BMS9Abin31_1004 [Gammaproteobacteria bacterium]